MINLLFTLGILSNLLAIDTHSGGYLSDNQRAMDVKFYDLNLKIDSKRKLISGFVSISFLLKSQPDKFEFDLIDSFKVSSVDVNGMDLSFIHKENKIKINNPYFDLNKIHKVQINYSGKPPVAKNPPWSGGFSWKKSKEGRPWIAVSCQLNGAHIWYPCKEHPSDKSDEGAKISISVPKPLVVASNGLLISSKEENHWKEWVWETKYPISTYNINFTAGNFKIVEKTGYILDEPIKLVYYVLPELFDGAETLLGKAEEYLDFYARHFGQYPFINEKFGLVQTPYLGMEHQTINAYGNNYKSTQLGYDFLMFHEMGHEWWGNYLSVSDWSDFWIHEGFDTYAEAMFVEEKYGSEALKGFVRKRLKTNIKNHNKLVGNNSSKINELAGNDVYYKGAHVLHMLRYLIGYDQLKKILREFIYTPKKQPNNQTSTNHFIAFVQKNVDIDLSWFFEKYLYQKGLPTLKVEKQELKNKNIYELAWVDKDFLMPLEISFNSFDGKRNRKLHFQNKPIRIAIPKGESLLIDPDSWLLFDKHYEN